MQARVLVHAYAAAADAASLEFAPYVHCAGRCIQTGLAGDSYSTLLHDLCKVPQRQSLRFVFIIFTLYCPLADATSLLGSLAHGTAFALQVISGSNTGDTAVYMSG